MGWAGLYPSHIAYTLSNKCNIDSHFDGILKIITLFHKINPTSEYITSIVCIIEVDLLTA